MSSLTFSRQLITNGCESREAFGVLVPVRKDLAGAFWSPARRSNDPALTFTTNRG